MMTLKKWLFTGTAHCLLAVAAIALCLLTVACRQRPTLNEQNSVYYWRTEWRLDSTELTFLQKYGIKRVYCRYFDVVMRGGKPMPNATISFPSLPPEGLELVPTVYITEDCMRAGLVCGGTTAAPAELSTDGRQLATKLVERIVQMNETNDISGVREIQIDCDYTLNSRHTYYAFLDAVRQEAKAHGLRLSTTIRLHQLSMPTPPADYGVLMIYNTGDPRNFEQRNPILDIRDVAPYLRYLADYPLPLAAAYPVYFWQRTIHGVSVEHTVSADEILNVKQAVEKRRPDLSRTILVYHLDKDNINRYPPETYEAIYHH